jgi:hypothetical protein
MTAQQKYEAFVCGNVKTDLRNMERTRSKNGRSID